MKIVDLNLVLYAVNADAPPHMRAREWWQSALAASETVGLPWNVVFGFLRISTRVGVLPRPLTVAEAVRVVNGWLAQPGVVVLNPGDRHWQIVSGLLERCGTAGNLTSDAHLAALAIEYGATLYSADGDFTRFGADLRFVNPLVL